MGKSQQCLNNFTFLNYYSNWLDIPMSTIKTKIQSILNQLPDNCSIEDIQYHLYVLEKVRQSLTIAQADGTITQEQVEGLLNKWLIE